MERKVMAIHSSRGGTGKTTVASNLAVTFAREGLNIALFDLDLRAPSLFDVFSKGIKKPVKLWINDFLLDRCKLDQTLIDVSEEYGIKGKLLIGLANPAIEAIRNMMGRSTAWEVAAAKKLFSIRTTLFDKLNIDCCILDTSPGIQYSSINGVASSDLTIIVTTLNSLDVKGVKNMLVEFYDEFEKKSAILINKVFPQTRMWSINEQNELITKMEKAFNRPIIGIIPCYCDVLEANSDSLLISNNSGHLFLEDLQEVAKKLERM
jgi:MinD-like ATPase involved in chromosome partitioning or flagellar assembly